MTEQMKSKIEAECEESCHPAVFETAIDWFLKNVWHDASKEPQIRRKYLVMYPNGLISGSWERHDDGFIPWKDVVKEHGFVKWCYTEDLILDTLQKGKIQIAI